MSIDNDRDYDGIRPILIIYPTIFSLLMLNYLIRVRKVKLAGVIISKAHIKRMSIAFSYLESSYILMRRSGLWYCIYLMFTIDCAYLIIVFWRIVGLFTGKKRSFKTFGRLLRDHHVPILKSKDINNEEAVDFMKNTGANMIISLYNNQILRYRTCKKFKYGAINIHNSLLPDFGGLDAAFEVLYHGVEETGVTAHLVDKGIDTGGIIYQEKIAVDPDDTVFSLNVRQWLYGCEQIPQILDLFREGPVAAEDQDLSNIKYPYQSFPKSEKVKKMMARGKRCICLNDIFVIHPYLLRLFPAKIG